MGKCAQSITETLLEAIERSGLSDYAIAKRSGVPQPTVTRFRNGSHRTIKLDTADKLAQMLGCRLVIGNPRKPAL